jgi:K+-transporting ATPase ATPase B chain
MKRSFESPSLYDGRILGHAAFDAVRKLDPRSLLRNPVIFATALVSAVTTVLFVRELLLGIGDPAFSGQIAGWLWFTVLFANFAEAVAEGRGRAQAETLRRTKTDLVANRLSADRSTTTQVPAQKLIIGDLVRIDAGELIPSDGEVIDGVASVDESAITGESAPVIREAGGDRSAVTGGTRVLSDWIIVRITSAHGETFLDRMIALVEGAERQKTPNEIALTILLVGLSLIFVLAVATIPGFAAYAGGTVPMVALTALFVTLIPTTIGALLSAIGIAGMDRLVRFNVLAKSGRAVEVAGDVDTLLIDKTGTITLGNRVATEFVPMTGVEERDLADAAQLASLSDATPEGRSIVVLAKERFGLRGRDMGDLHAHFVPFTAQTRMSGIDIAEHVIRKGSVDAIVGHVAARRRPRRSGTGPRPPEGCDQGRRARALRRAQADGNPHGDDHRRQRPDRGRHRRRGWRRRLPGAGNAGSKAEADPQRAGAGKAGGDVRRRHQRRTGAGTGGRGRRHEHRHARGAGSRQHDRPGLRSDEAHRDRRHRQAATDDPRRTHHVFDRQ